MSGKREAPAELRTRITEDPLDPADLLENLGDRRDGGLALFVGRVREVNEGRRVVRLRYEAYREMAEQELARIASEVAGRFEIGAIAAVHRVGVLAPGEASVAVAVAAPHRDAAYEASRAVVEAIKARLPVWKREAYADGTARWLGVPEAPGAGPGASAAESGAPAGSSGGARAGGP